jgi:resuscitation-promoting factor RpfA
LSSYFHKGRHRTPSTVGQTLARAGVVSAAVLGAVAVSTPAASADTLDTIEACESSGDPHASNGDHFGLYQFDLETWKSVGGKGNPMNASRGEQRSRAETLLARRGTQPWKDSADCWAGHSTKSAKHSAKKSSTPVRAAQRPATARPRGGPAHHTRAPENARQRPTQRAVSKIVKSDTVVVRPGDTLSGIAAAHDLRWRTLWERNRATVANPNVIFPGERIKL